jgi:hypothetical protein
MPATDILGKIGEKVGGQIKTLETSLTGDYATKVSLGSVQTNLGNVRASVGLDASGAYTANGSSNYLSSVTTLQGADNALDAQAKTNADAISTNAGAINTIEASAGLSAAGAYQADSSADYISGASSLAGADSLLDDQIKVNANAIATNASDITDLDNNKLDKTGGTISSNLIISGNLQVDGTTTTVNSTTVEVEDNAIEVNLGSSGAATANTAGIIVNRGSGVDKAQFLFDDTIDKFNLKVGTADGTLKVAEVEGALTGDVTGNVTGNVSGIVTVPNANGLVVNTTSLGDYSTFESAFNSAIA